MEKNKMTERDTDRHVLRGRATIAWLILPLLLCLGCAESTDRAVADPSQSEASLQTTPDFAYNLTQGELRTKIAFNLVGHDLKICFDSSGPRAKVISGNAALAQLQTQYSLATLVDYAPLLQHEASFALEVTNANGEPAFIVVPHPDETTLSGPTTSSGLTIFPFAGDDDPPSCTGSNGRYGGVGGGPVCKCDIDWDSCKDSCKSGCAGSESFDISFLDGICSSFDPFDSDLPLYDLNIGDYL